MKSEMWAPPKHKWPAKASYKKTKQVANFVMMMVEDNHDK